MKAITFIMLKTVHCATVATIAGRFPWVSMKQDCQMEYVVYRGEQMHSFDAVFSAKGDDGNPETICDPHDR